jgi:hypothetical protein
MGLEERLARVLHRVDDYAPRDDLLTRLGRSIDADVEHRGRLRRTVIAICALAVAAGVHLLAAVTVGRGGGLVLTGWKLELLETVVLAVLLVVLGPMIRRLGVDYLADVFRHNPETGRRFQQLLDIAYHLTFGGLIVLTLDVTRLDVQVPLVRALQDSAERLAAFLLAMGAAHAVNLLVLPVVGLVFGAGRRRVARRLAGDAAPPPSRRAVAADRVATWLVVGLAAITVVGVLLLVGILIGLGAS